MSNPKLAVLGLDCAEPSLVFDAFKDELPTLRGLMETGLWGKLRSCDPPITCPAWMVMVTGRTPGELGIYGFRNRTDNSYTGLGIATSRWVKSDICWDVMGRTGKKVISMAVPLTFPPKPINGSQVSCWLTPGPDSNFTYPPALREELKAACGPYIPDVRFRINDKEKLYQDIVDATDNHMAYAKWLLENKPWDFFMMVEMGTDRIHHGLWREYDKTHPRHPEGNPHQGNMLKYYKHVDQHLAKLIDTMPDDAIISIVSDHGIKSMFGGIVFNEWLIQEGYLVLKETPAERTPIGKAQIDWDKTKAWGDGGYYGRLFFNVKGREPQGQVAPEDLAALKDEISGKLEAITDEQGTNIGTRVLRPENIYPRSEGFPPDMIVYFGDLAWRSMGFVGGPNRSMYTYENDTGPDDANHAPDGIFILSTKARLKAGTKGPGEQEGLLMQNCSKTFLKLMNVEPSSSIGGTAIDLKGMF